MLLAIGYVVPEVGYCQGMNFIASVLVTVLEKEELAFWVFLEMLITRDMKTLFLPVSSTVITFIMLIFIGSTRVTSQEFLNGIAH